MSQVFFEELWQAWFHTSTNMGTKEHSAKKHIENICLVPVASPNNPFVTL